MSQLPFSVGDEVEVVDGGDYPEFTGKKGTVIDDGVLSGGLIGVSGLYGTGITARLKEKTLGVPGFFAGQLRHTG